MPGEQIEQLKVEGPFSGKIPVIWRIIRGEDNASKRLLAEWLLEALTTTVERSALLVTLLALIQVEDTLCREEFCRFLRAVREFYRDVTGSLKEDDPLAGVADNATADQRQYLVEELTPLLQGEGFLRDAAFAALVRIVANPEETTNARASLATTLQAHARGDEKVDVQKALKIKKA